MDVPRPAPALQWAIHVDPDLLVLQFPPVPVFADGGSRDAMKTLFERRGFRAVAQAEDLDLRPANGCALTRTTPSGAELLLSIGDEVGASRIPLSDVDAGWLARAVEQGSAAVLVVDSAVRGDATTSKDDLRRDLDAGGVLGALVPCADPVQGA